MTELPEAPHAVGDGPAANSAPADGASLLNTQEVQPGAAAAAAGLILQASVHGWQPALTIRSDLGSGVADVAMLRRSRSLLASGAILTRFGGNAVIWTRRFGPARYRPERA